MLEVISAQPDPDIDDSAERLLRMEWRSRLAAPALGGAPEAVMQARAQNRNSSALPQKRRE